MELRVKISRSTCFLLGAALGVTIALVAPSSIDADNKNKRENNSNGYKNVATNTSKRKEGKRDKFYGDKTMSDILEKARLGIKKVWPATWIVNFLNSRNSSTISSDVFVDAQSSFPKSISQIKESFGQFPDSGDDSIGTTYTPLAKLSPIEHTSATSKVRKVLQDIAKGYTRGNTSKNDSICKNYPMESTLIEPENKTTIEEHPLNERAETTPIENSSGENDKDKKLVLNLKTPFSPVIKVFQSVKQFQRSKKRSKMKNSSNAEINNSNGLQEIIET